MYHLKNLLKWDFVPNSGIPTVVDKYFTKLLTLKSLNICKDPSIFPVQGKAGLAQKLPFLQKLQSVQILYTGLIYL